MSVAVSRSGYARPSFAVRRGPLAGLRLPVHRSAWKGRSANFGLRGFYEVGAVPRPTPLSPYFGQQDRGRYRVHGPGYTVRGMFGLF